MQHGKVIAYASRQLKPYEHGYWASLRIEPDLISRIKEAQKQDGEIWAIVENQRASGLLQQLDIPVWKWDEISMD
nr:retrotransposon protein, putative, Ty3-gypsy subclass [Tanacetum cinerariifolium]